MIGAAVIHEAYKLVTGVGRPMALREQDNDLVLTIMDSIDSGVYSFGVRCEKLADCTVCGERAAVKELTLQVSFSKTTV